MINPNMILQGKQPDDIQHAKGQSEKEPSKGIFGAILNALQTNEDDGGKNLLSGMNSEEGENGIDSESGSENGAKSLLTLSALTNRLKEAEAGVASEHTDENAEDSVNNLANEQENSGQLIIETVKEEDGESDDNPADESIHSNAEISGEVDTQGSSNENSSEEMRKIVEGSNRTAVSGSDLNSVNMNAESEKSEASESSLQSEKDGRSQATNGIADIEQTQTDSSNNSENGNSDPSAMRIAESEENQVVGSANGLSVEASVKGVENTVVSEKVSSGRKGIKQPADERTPLQGRNQPVQMNESTRNHGGEHLFSTETGEQAGGIKKEPETGASSENSRDISVGQILQNGSSGMNEAGVAGAAVNPKSVNIDRLRDEKEKKMSARISNTASNSDQARNRDALENGSAKSLFSLSGGQDFGSLKISSEEGSAEESVLFWNRFGYEGSESVDDKKSNSLLMGLSRLSQIPIMNTTVRQQLLNGITQSVQKSAGTGKTAETWQKHTFSLENGKNVQISVRQVEGVLHLKLGSTNNELTKLLQMNQQEIKEHLQSEFDIEVDLEFSQQGDGSSSEWFDAMQGQNSSKRGYQTSSGEVHGNINNGQTPGRRVRDFGYNQMEWSA